jgi:hypothetical protein
VCRIILYGIRNQDTIILGIVDSRLSGTFNDLTNEISIEKMIGLEKE